MDTEAVVVAAAAADIGPDGEAVGGAVGGAVGRLVAGAGAADVEPTEGKD